MRFAELAEREDALALMCAALAAGWSAQHGRPVQVLPPAAAGQRFWLQPLLSACYGADVAAPARRFLADQFRATPVRWRAPAQWLLGTLLATPLGLRLTGEPAFTVVPALPGAENLLVVPGNRRVRVFDLAHDRVHVFAKPGFTTAGTARELALRRAPPARFVPPILEAADDGRWFEEPLLSALPVPRLPDPHERRAAAIRALHVFADWQDRARRPGPSGAYVRGLLRTIAALATAVGARFGPPFARRPQAWIEAQAAAAEALPTLDVAPSHGDLQPGNVLAEPQGRAFWIVDWEDLDTRLADYDLLVYGLGGRFRRGLGRRLADFVQTGRAGLVTPLLRAAGDLTARRATVARFLLEEYRWVLADSLAGPFVRPPRGLRDFTAEFLTPGSP